MFSFHVNFVIATICFCICAVQSQTISEETSAVTEPISTSTFQTPKNKTCEIHNNDCKACVSYSECYYCETDGKCNFHIQNIIADGACDITQAYFKTCKMSFKIMMITVGVLIGIALLIIMIVCCYCCCKRRGVKLSKDDLKWARQKEERKQIAEEKRKERAERTEEIRRKYGLVKDSNPYQRFDA